MPAPTNIGPLRIAAASAGDPFDPRTQSGVPKHLLDALEGGGALVTRINTTLRPWQRRAALLASFRRNGDSWRCHYRRSPLAADIRTRNLEAELRGIEQPLDAVLLVRSTYRPLNRPYAAYIDNSAVTTAAEWPEWAPWRGRFLISVLETERDYLSEAVHVFTTGERLSQAIVDAHQLNPDRVTTVGGGAHFSISARGSSPRDPIVLFVGYDFRRKGGDLLVEAFRLVRRRVPDARLVIVGPKVRLSEPGVLPLGNVADRRQLLRLFDSARVFALPARYEPYGMVLLEAMARGLPCVGTDVCAIPEIIGDGLTGSVVPPSDVPALADALTAILLDDALAERLGSKGQQRVLETHNWPTVARRITSTLTNSLLHV